MQVDRLFDQQMRLGESIIWDEQARVLLWVDVGYPSHVYRCDPVSKSVKKIEYSGLISGLALTDQQEIAILLTDRGLKRCNLQTGSIEHFLDVEPDRPENRCNDCGVDPQGRLWFGTMQNNLQGPPRPMQNQGSLYCLSQGRLVRQATNLGIPNTLLWSPDGNSFYSADSLAGKFYKYHFDGNEISNPAILNEFQSNGVPDGSAIDCRGNVWNCRWGDAAVYIFEPGGNLVRSIPIPAQQVTSCTFAGPEMTTLYVTTARHAISSADQAQYPQAGSIFVVETGIQGTTRGRVRLN